MGNGVTFFNNRLQNNCSRDILYFLTPYNTYLLLRPALNVIVVLYWAIIYAKIFWHFNKYV